MDERNILIVVGLACDLIGAFLLSIPLVWKSRAVGNSLSRASRSIIKRAKTFRKRHKRNLSVAGIAISLFIAVTLNPVGAVIERWIGPLSDLAWWTHLIVISVGTVVNFILMIFALAFLLGTAMGLTRELGQFFLYVAKGTRDKTVGIVGLVILCLGFALQTWVNFIT